MALLIVVMQTMQLGAGRTVAPGVIRVALGGLFAFFLVKTRRVGCMAASIAARYETISRT